MRAHTWPQHSQTRSLASVCVRGLMRNVILSVAAGLPLPNVAAFAIAVRWAARKMCLPTVFSDWTKSIMLSTVARRKRHFGMSDGCSFFSPKFIMLQRRGLRVATCLSYLCQDPNTTVPISYRSSDSSDRIAESARVSHRSPTTSNPGWERGKASAIWGATVNAHRPVGRCPRDLTGLGCRAPA